MSWSCWIEFGLTPRQALQAATNTASEALQTTKVGVIEPDRTADLVAERGDPLADISLVREVSAVWREGRPVVAQPFRDVPTTPG